MSEQNPSEVLRAAARHIRQLAEHFEGYVDAQSSVSRWDTAAESWHYDAVDRNALADAKSWIAAFSPAIAGPLAVWLEVAANDVQGQEHVSPTWPALAVARLVLSSVPNPPGEAM